MGIKSCSLAVAVASVVLVSPLAAQSPAPDRSDWSFDVGIGMSKYGSHAMVGLEYAMTRWLAARADFLAGMVADGGVTDRPFPERRLSALSISGVLTMPTDTRVTPYLLGGYATSASQGLGFASGLLGGAGVRVKLGRFTPYIEGRAQHRAGVPILIGIRF